MRKAEEFRNLDDAQLDAEARTLRQRLYELRNQKGMSKLDHPHEMREAKRELAMILTIVNERASSSSAETTA